MMNQERWDKLREIFDNDELFTYDEESESEWYDTAIPGSVCIVSDLFDWLECSSRPSYSMIKEFSEHGYYVHAGERDSFGWLTGVVTDNKTGRNICFG